MSVLQRILIAYDGSPGSDTILQDLSCAGIPRKIDVTVVTVADVWLPFDYPSSDPASSGPVPDAAREAHARACAEIESSRATASGACARLKLEHPEWRIQARAFGDSPGWRIVKEAEAFQADLVVLGSHGRSALEKFFLGSVAQKVAAEARCSVRIARPRKHSDPPLRIMVAVDGSSDSQEAVDHIVRREWMSAVEFRVITVIDSKLETGIAWSGVHAARWVKADDRSRNDWAKRPAEHAASSLLPMGRRVETRVLEGDPKQLILREAGAWPADCIFLGARGLHHGNRLFLGSLASAVAARAHCTVEIVRSKGATGDS